MTTSVDEGFVEDYNQSYTDGAIEAIIKIVEGK
jgi:hypothetical protein